MTHAQTTNIKIDLVSYPARAEGLVNMDKKKINQTNTFFIPDN